MNRGDTAAEALAPNIVAFKFHLRQRVRLKDLDEATFGRVLEMSVGRDGREYRVAYFDEDKRRQIEWFTEDELV